MILLSFIDIFLLLWLIAILIAFVQVTVFLVFYGLERFLLEYDGLSILVKVKRQKWKGEFGGRLIPSADWTYLIGVKSDWTELVSFS